MERSTRTSNWKINRTSPNTVFRPTVRRGPTPNQFYTLSHQSPLQETVQSPTITYPPMEQKPGYQFRFGPHPAGLDKYCFVHGSPNTFVWCGICQYRFGKKLFHRHYSTEYFHFNIRSQIEVLCPSCKFVHPIENNGIKITLFTSSTLHGVIHNQAVCTDFHMDIESIAGAHLVDLWKNWQKAYGNEKTKQAVVVVAGLNDVAKKSPDAFMQIVKAWHFEVMALNEDNLFFFTKLMRPPKLAWFSRNGNLPSQDYVNYLDKINEINQAVDKFNEELHSFPVVGFQTEGCRSGGSKRALDGTMLVSKTAHNIKAWREADQGPQHCLHLKESLRISMFKRLCAFIHHRIIIPNSSTVTPLQTDPLLD